MWISKAYAAAIEGEENIVHLDSVAQAPSQLQTFVLNVGVVAILVILFYLLLIVPQQRRFREHGKMLNNLKKGDSVVTGGGLVGKIEKVLNDREVLIDLGSGIKVTALRSTIQGKTDIFLKPANDPKPAVKNEKNKPEKQKSKAKDSKTEASE